LYVIVVGATQDGDNGRVPAAARRGVNEARPTKIGYWPLSSILIRQLTSYHTSHIRLDLLGVVVGWTFLVLCSPGPSLHRSTIIHPITNSPDSRKWRLPLDLPMLTMIEHIHKPGEGTCICPIPQNPRYRRYIIMTDNPSPNLSWLLFFHQPSITSIDCVTTSPCQPLSTLLRLTPTLVETMMPSERGAHCL
jgi:hypothetical protein